MQEEIINLYEKISDQLSEEEFQAQIDEILMENDLYDEVDAAHIILEKYGVDDESSDESGDEAGVEMSAEILEYYNKVKDKISPEDFLNRMDYYKSKNEHASFMSEETFAEMVVGEYVNEEIEVISEQPDYAADTIDKLEKDMKDATVSGRVISISNPRSFKTRKGQSGQVCNVELKDNTGTIRTVFWTQNIKLLKNVNEGEIIQIKGVDIKEGYSGLEGNLRQRSTLIHLD